MGSAPFFISWGIFLMQTSKKYIQIRTRVSVCKNVPHFCILDGYS